MQCHVALRCKEQVSITDFARIGNFKSMNNRRFNLQDEVNGEENRDRMGAGVFMLIFLGKGSYKVFC